MLIQELPLFSTNPALFNTMLHDIHASIIEQAFGLVQFLHFVQVQNYKG